MTCGFYDETKALLQKGANPNFSVVGDESLLMIAAHIGEIEMVKLLIEFGANVDAKDARGKDAIDWANNIERPDIAEVIEKERAERRKKE